MTDDPRELGLIQVRGLLGSITAELYEKIDHEAAELLDAHKPREPGRPARNSKNVPSEALGLLSRCVELGIPPPVPLFNLIKELLEVSSPALPSTRPNLSDEQWKALEREFEGTPDQPDPSRSWPSKAPAITVARAAGVSKRVVEQWRNSADYTAGFHWLRHSKIAEEVAKRLADQDIKQYQR